MANIVTAQLLFLEGEDAEKDVHLYINSPGGSMTASLAMYDAMQYVRPHRGDDVPRDGRQRRLAAPLRRARRDGAWRFPTRWW